MLPNNIEIVMLSLQITVTSLQPMYKINGYGIYFLLLLLSAHLQENSAKGVHGRRLYSMCYLPSINVVGIMVLAVWVRAWVRIRIT